VTDLVPGPRPWLRVTVPPRVARFLIAAGARPAPPSRAGGRVSITEYLEQHRGEIVTAEQVAAATGETVQFTRIFLREAGDRDWAERVPGGWRTS